MWYDFFSLFYDRALEKLYRSSRAEAVAALQATPGSVVLDLACGTGQNFPLLELTVDDGLIIGVDNSVGMLNRARARIADEGWTNVRLVESNVLDFTADELEVVLGGRMD